MSGGVAQCCTALLLALTTVSAVKRQNSIEDLKRIDFGQSVPKHSLILLHWFANIVDIDNNDVILLTFEPNRGDYGSHHYGNYERLLHPLPRGNIRYRYYTVGNLRQANPNQLPTYVLHPPSQYVGRNLDRIVFRVRGEDTIDQVYMTQHYEASTEGTQYDPAHTYRITTNLLRQIREFSVGENQTNTLEELGDDFGSDIDYSQLRSLEQKWGELACLGLLLFIVIEEKYSSNLPKKPQHKARRNTQPDFTVNIPVHRQNHWDVEALGGLLEDQIELKVITGTDGKAMILWGNVPRYRLNEGAMVVLFSNNKAQNHSFYKSIGNEESGSCNTSVLLNNDLQARLHETRTHCCFLTRIGPEICRGEEFQQLETVGIAGYNANLQLFVQDGKACARLLVGKSFAEWKSHFNKAWIGFYTDSYKDTNEYEWWQWQWATKFQPSINFDYNYDAYEYHSGMAIAPGVQARFILRGVEVKACTPSWK